MLISSCSLKVCLVSEYKPVRHRVVEDMHVACSDHIVEEVEVALTILKLTGTGRRADGQAGRRDTSKYRDACASKNAEGVNRMILLS